MMFKYLFFLISFLFFSNFAKVNFDSLHVPPQILTEDLLLFKALYEKNYITEQRKTSRVLIPKRIHQIWIGTKPLPEKFLWMIKTIKKNHPNWKYKLWTNKDLKSFKLKNKKVFDKLTNIGAKADIFRYEILERYGGVYFDIDFESLKSLDELSYYYSFCAGLLCGTDLVANGFIACSAHHPILRECVLKINKIEQFNGDFDFILGLTGPFFLTKSILKYLAKHQDQKDIIILPSDYLFPLPAGLRFNFWDNNLSRDRVLSFVKPESLAIHYWATSWQN